MYKNKQNKTKLKWWMIFILMLATFSIPTLAWGQEGTLKFHVQPEFPDSQLEGSSGYFDLNLAPNQTEKLVLILKNDQEEPIQVKITPHTAYTNVSGLVEYGKDAENPDPTLIHSLENLIEVPSSIELGGKESKTVEINLVMPEESFEGILAGGLRIEEVPKEQEQLDEGEKIAIKNEFSYVVGVIVSNNRSFIEPDIHLVDIFANQLNYRNVFSATIQNPAPSFINRLEVEAEVRKENSNDILYTAKQEQLQMAPNSHFDFPISLNGDRFVSGTYVLTMTARSNDNEWKWTETFTIDAEEARKLNRADVTLDSGINWWMIVAAILTVSILVIIGYLFYQKKKRERAYEEKRKNLKRKSSKK